MSSTEPEKTHVEPDAPADDVDDDTQTDPALDDDEGTEWSDEGGAVSEGPATDVDNT